MRSKKQWEQIRHEMRLLNPNATEEELDQYIEDRIREDLERWEYEDGDHHEPREPRMPEHDYPY